MKKDWSKISLILGTSLTLGTASIVPFIYNNNDTTIENTKEAESSNYVFNKPNEHSPFSEPKDLNELKNTKPEEIAKLDKYDSRKYNIVTPVKNQFNEGICWAYAGSAVAETNVLRQGLTTDVNGTNFSPNYMDLATKKRNDSFNIMDINRNDILNKPLGTAGSAVFCEQTYSVWAAPAALGDHDKTTQYVDPAYVLTDSEFFIDEFDKELYEGLTEEDVHERVNRIKLGIAKYGALTFDSSVQTRYLNGKAATHYNNNNDWGYSSGHALTVVGWDDTIPRDAFGPTTPKYDGGFLIKDSWGANSHGNMNGYFWMSYDSSYGSCIGYNFAKPHEKYDNNYHWDAGEAFNDDNEWGKKECAVIYPVQKANFDTDEYLNAVNVSIVGRDLTVDVEVYNNVQNVNRLDPYNQNINPKNGTRVFKTSKTFERGGTKTIEIPDPIKLTKGQYFSIVVKVSSAVNKGYLSLAVDTSKDDMTYAYVDNKWQNHHTNMKLSATARIRGFTKEVKKAGASSTLLSDATVRLDKTNFRYGEADDKRPKPKEVKIGDKVLTENNYDVIYSDLDLRKTNNDISSIDSYIGFGYITLKGKNGYSGEITLSYDVYIGMAPNIGKHGWYTPDIKYPWNISVANIRIQDNWRTYSDIELPEGFVWERPNDLIDINNPCGLEYHGPDAKYYRFTRFQPGWTLFLYDSNTPIPSPEDILNPKPEPPSVAPVPPFVEDPECDIKNAKITLDGYEFKYKGQPVEPKVLKVITQGGADLSLRTVIVSYKDNNKPGTGKVIVTGDYDNTAYYGTQEIPFTILNEDGSKPEPKPEPTPEFTSLDIVIKNQGTIFEDDTIFVDAIAEGNNLENVEYTWEILNSNTQINKSSNSASFVAKLDDNRKTLRVSATCKDKTITKDITLNISKKETPIVPQEPILEDVSISWTNRTYNVGEIINASAVVYPRKLSDLEYSWYLDGNFQNSGPSISFPAEARYNNKNLELRVSHKGNVKSDSVLLSIEQPKQDIPSTNPSNPQLDNPDTTESSRPGNDGILPPSNNTPSKPGNIVPGSDVLQDSSSNSSHWDWWIYVLIGAGGLLIIIGIILAIVGSKRKKENNVQEKPVIIKQVQPVQVKTIPLKTGSTIQNSEPTNRPSETISTIKLAK